MTNDFPVELMMGSKWVFHLLFYRIPKNASTSIYRHLGSLNLINKHSNKFNELADKRIYKGWFDPTHARQQEVFKVFGHEMQNYFSFCVVRNPWDRVLSMYCFSQKHRLQDLYGIVGEVNFVRFCEILHANKDNPLFIATFQQMDWISGPYPPKEILRFENLQEQFANMIRSIGANHIPVDLPRLNQTVHAKYRDCFNQHSRDLIRQTFERDIDELKYTF